MIRLLVTLLLTCEVCLIKASCPDDQEPGFCNGADNHPQLYCPGVDIHVNKWTCSSKNRVRCVCKEGYFRAMNGRCVKDCGLAPPQTEHIPEKPASPKVQDYTYIIPPELDGSPKYLDNAKMFLQNNERIVLVEISKNAWKNSPCVCITSRLIQATESGAKRMIECYKYATLISAPKTIEDQIGTKKLGPFLQKLNRIQTMCQRNCSANSLLLPMTTVAYFSDLGMRETESSNVCCLESLGRMAFMKQKVHNVNKLKRNGAALICKTSGVKNANRSILKRELRTQKL
uniref:Lipocalin n=1 Tax=Rhipicephalus appendiculatus TaxID=34631 RepID=A0A131YTV3_RHIAP